MSFLAASFAASGSLATGFSSYFAELWAGPRPCWCRWSSSPILVVINFIGITESVVINMLMTFVELSELIIVMGIADLLRRPGQRQLQHAHRHQRLTATRLSPSWLEWRCPSSP